MTLVKINPTFTKCLSQYSRFYTFNKFQLIEKKSIIKFQILKCNTKLMHQRIQLELSYSLVLFENTIFPNTENERSKTNIIGILYIS